MKYYILDDNQPVPCGLEEYCAFMDKLDARRVAYEERGGVAVSTVFLCIDHNWGEGKPVLWETMVFGGPDDEYQQRYTSHNDAVAGHAECVKRFLGTQVLEAK